MSTAEVASSLSVPAIALSAGELSFYRQQGYLQIPGLLSAETAQQLCQEVLDIMRVIGDMDGSKLKQTPEYLAGTRLDQFINSDALNELAAQLLGGSCSIYLPFTAVKGSGGGTFHFHQDDNYTRFEDGMLGINFWFALTDMSPENGCLMIAPASHLAGQLESEDASEGDHHRKVRVEPADFLPIRMRAGDCVAFSRLTVHGSGPNNTPDPRVAYAVQFFRDDAHFFDRKSGARKPLIEHSPQMQYVRPVEQLTVPKGKIDGH